MKTILFLVLLCAVRAEDSLTVASSQYTTISDSMLTYPTTLSFANGLTIDCATGEVKIPKDLKLSDASKEFWREIENAFPYSFRGDRVRKDDSATGYKLDAVEIADALTALMDDRRRYLQIVKKLVETRPEEEQDRFKTKLEYEDLTTLQYEAILAKWQKRAKGEQP